jgi:hypothetical protein
MLRLHRSAFVGLLALALAAPALAQEDAGITGPAFKEGDVITFDKLDSLKPFLPPEFWANRDFFFYEGMRLEVGPFYADYTPAAEYLEATQQYKGQARLGPDGSLENYTAGQPFPMDEIDCKGDPQAGLKILWDFDYRWEGDGTSTRFFYSYWDRGEQLPLYRAAGEAGRRSVPQGAAQERLRHRGDGSLRRPRHQSDDLPLQGLGQVALGGQERRHLGVPPHHASGAADLRGPAHRRRLGHRLHVRRSAQLLRDTTSGPTASPTRTTTGSCARL